MVQRCAQIRLAIYLCYRSLNGIYQATPIAACLTFPSVRLQYRVHIDVAIERFIIVMYEFKPKIPRSSCNRPFFPGNSVSMRHSFRVMRNICPLIMGQLMSGFGARDVTTDTFTALRGSRYYYVDILHSCQQVECCS